MPVTFFDLPREIRDIIYAHVLISPTGLLAPVPVPQTRKPASTSISTTATSTPQYRLHYTPTTHLTLSLPRTNRQIALETQHLLYTSNTFTFPTPTALISSLKSISQTPSRLITSISLPISLEKTPMLARALRLLASRARWGALRRLELTVGRREFIGLLGERGGGKGGGEGYDRLLGVLRGGWVGEGGGLAGEVGKGIGAGVGGGGEGKEGGKGFERVMSVRTLLREWRVGGGHDHETVRELHFAWGGRMIVNGEVEWVGFEHVGRCAGVV